MAPVSEIGQNTTAEHRTDCVDRLYAMWCAVIDDDINRELVAVL